MVPKDRRSQRPDVPQPVTYLPPKRTRRVSGRRSSIASSRRASRVLSMTIMSPAVAITTPPHEFFTGLSASKETSMSLTKAAPFSFSAQALYLLTAPPSTFLTRLAWPDTPRTETTVPSRRMRPSTMRLSSRDEYLSDCTSRPRRFAASPLSTPSCASRSARMERRAERTWLDWVMRFWISMSFSLRSYSARMVAFSASTMRSFSMLNSSSAFTLISLAFSSPSCLMNFTIWLICVVT
mmetsp:Transcript_17382/g.46933  ORF Transcript_17382/g.46933 Transcript_17382/m.46933 type:complete len:238 (+) Transcript_17382:415-1128(+)